jgi:hypothetical protein
VIGAAVKVAKITAGEIVEESELDYTRAAAQLGRRGGRARAESLTKPERHKIAKLAARARWNRKN